MNSSGKLPKKEKSTRTYTLSTFLSSLDIFGTSPELSFNGKETEQTFCGVITSILIVLTVVSLLISQILWYLDINNPTATTAANKLPNPPGINVFTSLIVSFPMFLTDTNTFTFMDPKESPKYVTVKGEILRLRLNLKTNQTETVFSKKFDYEPCGVIFDSNNPVH